MLASFTAGMEYPRGDVDQNGQVDIADVTCLIDYLLTGTWEDAPVTPPDNHEWVDLGLDSGTLWATCNVGAETPEEYGDYFAWGETTPQQSYDWNTYKWCEGSEFTMTKYCTRSNYGTIDNKTELDPEDDVAYVNWSPLWRTPTEEQLQELIDSCTWSWTSRNSVKGFSVVGPNGNSIFLPAAGSVYDTTMHNVKIWGYYWSRTLCPDYDNNAIIFACRSGYEICSNGYRYLGCCIRPVRVSTR